MKESYIIYAKRTPIGRIGGQLAPVRVDDLMAHLLRDFKSQNLFPLEEIDDVIVGCANQAGEDNRNVARMAVVLADYPLSVPGVTINRLCASSLDGIIDATCRINAGYADCILVGGTESMSRGPLVISKSGTPFGRDNQMYDTTFGWRFPNKKMQEMFPLYSMGETAEEVNIEYNFTRQEQDEFALNSHKKALSAWDQGLFNDEISPIEVKLRKSSYTVERDEGPRADTDMTKLGNLKPVFRKNGTVTAGNASSMNDGSALVAVVSGDFLKKHNLKPMTRVVGGATHGLHPNTMGLGPVGATQKLCKRFGLKVSDFDIVELNEAFAVQSLACIKALNIDPSIVNLNGGAISLGHPLGCSGARISTTLNHLMQNFKNTKLGLATMCVGVGQGVAVAFENC